MPGLLAHIAMGVLIGTISINSLNIPQQLGWFFIGFCIFMSCLPDVFYPLIYLDLITHEQYVRHWFNIGHIVIPILTLGVIILLVEKVDIPNENFIMVGLFCVLVHAVVDYILPNRGVLW